MDASHVIGAITEIFSWIGFGAALVLGLIAIIARLADGTWVPVRAFVLSEQEPPILRWFTVGHTVGEAPLTPELRAAAGDADEVDVFTNPQRPGSVRLHQHSPLPRFLGWGAIAFGGLGVVSTIVQLILVAMR
ncbi:hypothetical protein M1D46_14435 [Microbacterium sp. JZ70]|uniref:DUF3592 domain-containing protein n=1 Tax=Microbacterium barkeri TaxID=33917 RepID=A0A9W6H400_9MICO|nr:hypothetical protein [Microbacterium barkeri]MDR6876750.1 hypothetical protein [Microbacterium barkeri]GLJ62191.1 hypothetical protein GCM10017576_23210 [Microbacterium barkeri]